MRLISLCYNRYAFSPLIDAGDEEDEEDETPLNDAFGKHRF